MGPYVAHISKVAEPRWIRTIDPLIKRLGDACISQRLVVRGGAKRGAPAEHWFLTLYEGSEKLEVRQDYNDFAAWRDWRNWERHQIQHAIDRLVLVEIHLLRGCH
jgi:hypothetical protein